MTLSDGVNPCAVEDGGFMARPRWAMVSASPRPVWVVLIVAALLGFAAPAAYADYATDAAAVIESVADSALAEYGTGYRTVTATVTDVDDDLTPTGSVTFTVLGGPNLDQVLESGTRSVSGAGAAATAKYLVPTSYGVGSYLVRSVFTPASGSNVRPSTAPDVVLTVLPRRTSSVGTATVSATFPTQTIRRVVLSARVHPTSPTNAPADPTGGSVTFTVRDATGTTISSLGSAPVSNGLTGDAFVVDLATNASYELVTSYSGAGNYAASAEDVRSFLVGQSGTAITLTAGATPVMPNQTQRQVAISATISPTASGAPSPSTGTVTYEVRDISGALVGSFPSIPVTDGAAATRTLNLGIASYTVSATYTGGGNYGSSSASTPLTVDPIGTTITPSYRLTAPSNGQRSVVLDALVAAASPSTAKPSTGSVFYDVKTLAGVAVFTAEVASISNGVPTTLSRKISSGTYVLTASYAGARAFASSTASPVTFVVDP